MIQNPLVSVIIAVRNGERFLAAAIKSVLAQNYQPYEIIVVDGHSIDATAEIAKSIESVRFIEQVNQGIADAYNVGIDAAKGELLAFLSHDDLWTPNKLRVQVNHLIRHPEIQYVIARVRFFIEPGCSLPAGFREELLFGDRVGLMMETLVARKTLFQVIGKFDPHFSPSDDADWFARASDHQIPRAVMPEVLLYKRVHDANLTFTTPENYQKLLRVLKRSIERKRHSSKREWTSRS
jgi:glycosyltransferase involved in cell wall biosynthesis